MLRLVLTALVALSTGLAAPMALAGSLSLRWSPSGHRETAAIETAFAAYQIARAVKSEGKVTQSGHGLSAALRQIGTGHIALIDQKGRDHDADVVQSGAPNALALIQRGKGTRADIAQHGRQTGVLLLYGW